MEEGSAFSVNSTDVTTDGSDSHALDLFRCHNPGTWHGTFLPPSRYKGVISQANGHWGAQIYINHQRIWLGTFKSEKEAALAYDSAALKLRSGESPRNVPWTTITIQEPNFQTQFSTKVVLNMIKDGSYQTRFADYLRSQLRDSCMLPKLNPTGQIMGKQLFQKELTPSDVGKLNRLVIPKRFAVKYFHQIWEDPNGREGVSIGVEDRDLIFLDRAKKKWKFRYCYWKSSQSYVFTRGWNRFVKEKRLRAKDVIIFSLVERNEKANELQNLCMIDVQHGDGAVEDEDSAEETALLEMRLSYDNVSGDEWVGNKREPNGGGVQENKKGLRLFGVQIA